MKHFNTTLILFTLIVSFFSCSSDDATSSDDTGSQIVGEWKLIASKELENGEVTEFFYEGCITESREVFQENGNYNFEYHSDPEGDCVVEYESTSGVWTYEDGIYDLIYEVVYHYGSTSSQTIPAIRFEDGLMYFRYTEVVEDGQVVEYYDRVFEKLN